MPESTFQDKMRDRDLLLQRMAVWQELHEHLLKFLDSDAIPTKLGIRSKGETLTVSQSIITVVRAQIETEIGRLDIEVGNINKAKVAENETKRENPTAPKAEGTPAKGNPKGKGGGGKSPKPVPGAS
jgi:hypothetical protein